MELMVLNCQSFTWGHILFLLFRSYIAHKQATNKYFPDYVSSKRPNDVVMNYIVFMVRAHIYRLSPVPARLLCITIG